jgi:hypothetical protein
MGHILLEGGAEFGGRMAVPDRRAIRLAGGADACISIIPAAAPGPWCFASTTTNR